MGVEMGVRRWPQTKCQPFCSFAKTPYYHVDVLNSRKEHSFFILLIPQTSSYRPSLPLWGPAIGVRIWAHLSSLCPGILDASILGPTALLSCPELLHILRRPAEAAGGSFSLNMGLPVPVGQLTFLFCLE